MKRSKQLFRNSCIIFVILFCIYYFGGFYFSKEECVHDTVRSLHGNETIIVLDFEYDNESITLLTNESKESVSIIGTKRIGFLYHTASSYTGQKINKDQSIFITGMWQSDYGQVIVVHRNHPDIAKIVVDMNDGNEITFTEFRNDFAGKIIKNNNWTHGMYRVYDKNNQLIEEIEY